MAAAVISSAPAEVATSEIKRLRTHRETDDRACAHSTTCSPALSASAPTDLPDMRAIVGFAAETGDQNGDGSSRPAKLAARRVMLVVNAVGDGPPRSVDNNDGRLLEQTVPRLR